MGRHWDGCPVQLRVVQHPSWMFEHYLTNLEENIEAWSGRKLLIVVGDLKIAAMKQGSRKTNSRGEALLEMAARREVVALNDGRAQTFCRTVQKTFLDLRSHVLLWRRTS